MEEDIKILKEYLEECKSKFLLGSEVYGTELYKPISNILNRLEQDERVIEEIAKQIEKDTEWYLSDFDGMTVENIIDHLRKKCGKTI
jgi:hypothetical protein